MNSLVSITYWLKLVGEGVHVLNVNLELHTWNIVDKNDTQEVSHTKCGCGLDCVLDSIKYRVVYDYLIQIHTQ